MTLRFAFVGFRHGHIFSALQAVKTHPETELVAACEEDAATRQSLADGDQVRIDYDNYARMLSEVECDVVAVGDYYGKRGSRIIEAIEAGKHVLTDKPVCTSLAEQERIEALVHEKGLSITCQFSLRGSGQFIALRRLISEGAIGEVQTVTVTGQHPLSLGSRPQWYFEPGCHGGTINDIGIHGIDMVEWATGRRITQVTAARAWNAKAVDIPHFKDCAQFMLQLDNGGSVLGDMSYLAPADTGAMPGYWRFTCHGTRGMVETNIASKDVFLAVEGKGEARRVPAEEGVPDGYVNDLVMEIKGQAEHADLTTEQVLRISRVVLTAQHVADTGKSAFGMATE